MGLDPSTEVHKNLKEELTKPQKIWEVSFNCLGFGVKLYFYNSPDIRQICDVLERKELWQIPEAKEKLIKYLKNGEYVSRQIEIN